MGRQPSAPYNLHSRRGVPGRLYCQFIIAARRPGATEQIAEIVRSSSATDAILGTSPQIARIFRGTNTSDAFDDCPNTRPAARAGSTVPSAEGAQNQVENA